jgi:hypothetical protein
LANFYQEREPIDRISSTSRPLEDNHNTVSVAKMQPPAAS